MNAPGSAPRPPPVAPERPKEGPGRFMLFSVERYNEMGGIDDLFGRYNSVQEGIDAYAPKVAQEDEFSDATQVIYDIEAGRVVAGRSTRDHNKQWIIGGMSK